MEKYSDNCDKCSLCHLIEMNNLPSLRIIEPDGNFIKKEQIIDLQNAFAKESQYTKEQIYIIKNCEKMNKESANTMLKFLEEPASNVIGFFITEHIGNVLSTIQSRCQKIEERYDENLDIKDEYDDNIFTIAEEIIDKIEKRNIESLFIEKNYFENMEKNDIVKVFQCMLKIYLKTLHDSLNFNEKKIDINIITKKLNIIEEILNEISYNVNVNLLIDKFVIEMDELNESL